MHCIFVGINCYVLEPLIIYFLLMLKSFQRRDYAYFLFFQNRSIGPFFFPKQTYIWSLIRLKKKKKTVSAYD
jgi:hypothetical protein